MRLLEGKLASLITLCHYLRDENAQLRLDLSAMQSDSTLLKTNMAQAYKRIEALMESLP